MPRTSSGWCAYEHARNGPVAHPGTARRRAGRPTLLGPDLHARRHGVPPRVLRFLARFPVVADAATLALRRPLRRIPRSGLGREQHPELSAVSAHVDRALELFRGGDDG